MQARPGRIEYGTTRNRRRQLRRSWAPVGRPRAVVLIVHGIAEHSGRYAAVAQQMNDAGLAVVGYDQRGHGQTEGPRGHVDRFTEFLDDVEDHLAMARQVGVPVVLLGHSMGGLISAAYAISDRPQPDLLVLSGPALAAALPAWQRTAVDKLAQLRPKTFLSPPLDSAVLSRDPEVGARYEVDPLIRPGGSAQLLSQLFETAESTAANIAKLSLPTLCLHGGDDELVPARASEVLIGLPGVERREIGGLRHEVFNEPEGPQLVADVIDWIETQLESVTPLSDQAADVSN